MISLKVEKRESRSSPTPLLCSYYTNSVDIFHNARESSRWKIVPASDFREKDLIIKTKRIRNIERVSDLQPIHDCAWDTNEGYQESTGDLIGKKRKKKPRQVKRINIITSVQIPL